MEDALTSYIQEQIAAGHNLPAIMQALQEAGYSQEAIDAGIRTALAKKPTSNLPSPTPKHHGIDLHHIDLTQAFLSIGAILILIATLIAVSSEWDQIGPWGRILFIAIPNALLFGLTAFLAKSETYQEAADYTLGIGSAIFPFTLGTIFYQLKLIPSVDSPLILASTGLSLLLYLLFEFGLGKEYISVFTATSTYILLITLASEIKLDDIFSLWLTGGISILFLIAGIALIRAQRKDGPIFATIGTIGSVLLLPAAILVTLEEKAHFTTESLTVLSSLFGFVSLGLAAYYNYLGQQLHNNYTIYQLKRALEELSPLILIVPYLILGVDTPSYAAAATILSIISIIASTKIWVNSFLYVGVLGLTFSLLMIIFKEIADSSTSTIVIFITGFLAIGIGLLVRKLTALRRIQPVEHPVWGLGRDIEQEKAVGPHRRFGCLSLIAIIVLTYFAITTLATFLITSNRLHNSSDYNQTYSTPTPSLKTYTITGRITQLSSTGVTIEETNGYNPTTQKTTYQDESFILTSSTTYRIGNAPASYYSLSLGQKVTAQYQDYGTKEIVSLTVLE